RGYCKLAVEHISELPADPSGICEILDGNIAILAKMMGDEMWFAEPPHSDFAQMIGIRIKSHVKELSEAIERTQWYRAQICERWPLTRQEFEYAFPVDVEEV